MTENNKKEKHGVNPAAAAGAGAVIGAGIAVAATAALKNPKTRKKIMSTLEVVKDNAMEKIPRMMNKKDVKAVKKAGKKVEKDVEKRIRAGKKAAHKVKADAVVN